MTDVTQPDVNPTATDLPETLPHMRYAAEYICGNCGLHVGTGFAPVSKRGFFSLEIQGWETTTVFSGAVSEHELGYVPDRIVRVVKETCINCTA